MKKKGKSLLIVQKIIRYSHRVSMKKNYMFVKPQRVYLV